MALTAKVHMEHGSIPQCPVSGSRANKFLCEVDGFRVWRNPQSATDFVWPVPSKEQLKSLYGRREWFEGSEKGGYESYDRQTEPVLPLFTELLTQYECTAPGRSILDVGCGYGSHLALAAERGWQCFGVEISDYARSVAEERYPNKLFVVDSVAKLIPHAFDVILLLDVLEHLDNPQGLFFELFSKGAITPRTKIVITTPNARSGAAVADPAAWCYRHPPSHLVYYSAESLRLLMSRLHFSKVKVEGIHPVQEEAQATYADESSALNDSLMGYAGLLCQAEGSNFAEFMQERYVPGTWSKLAEYEHVPRYLFAREFVSGAQVLDFACGSGYGSALLAAEAQSVRAVDIDEPALQWAREHHTAENLNFEQRDDLASALPQAAFDVITCFELIEHLDEARQVELLVNFARLLRPGGKLLISTPNPAITALYGENPYHLRERTRNEFESLLRDSYRHVTLLNQWLRPSVLIDAEAVPQHSSSFTELETPGSAVQQLEPVAFIAVCSQKPVGRIPSGCYFDSSFSYPQQVLAQERNFNEAQLKAYQQSKRVSEIATDREHRLAELNLRINNLQRSLAEKDAVINAFQQSKVIRLRDAIRHQPFSFRKIATIAWLVAAMATPRWLRRHLQPTTLRAKEFLGGTQSSPAPSPPLIRTLTSRPKVSRLPEVTKLSVVIPTKNAGPGFRKVLTALQQQQFAGEVELIVIDSGSSDETADIAVDFGAGVVHIAAEEFNHGSTRDLGVRLASGEVVVLMTQDAVPGDANLLTNLAREFCDPQVAGAYARQIPQPDADVLTKRNLNAWLTGRVNPETRWIEDEASYRAMSPMQQYFFCNFDNVCAAVRKCAYREIPFLPSSFGEDIEWGKRALESGWKITYQPAAHVIHSHQRSMRYEYHRTFACHQKLHELFGLRTVPSLFAVAVSTVRATLDDYRFIVQSESTIRQKLAVMAWVPFWNAAAVYGQYRGAKSARLSPPRSAAEAA